ncbi:hypothetical protein CS063_06015 [Sporanaerobium hydrogeniformans]|uniref:Uncharacterized protein n=1 Tax=Sporanaerobium hydrogeniformans TaxID=3072179 RepID=A0AC61DEC0_9FIRM|nr:ABC transporter ATP-binding protein [Sporanaerobium hydrogeniformans]PHV71245.1 hypothetical protein CS063_06015 [Sporanaerobium hydrogeniformans]
MKKGISIHEVTKSFLGTNGDKVYALDKLTFEPPHGKITALIGPSGCGKSTLLNIIGGFETADTGEVCLQAMNGQKPCMVFQSPALFDWLTVSQNVEFGLKRQHVPIKERKRAVRQMLTWVGLEAFKDAYPNELSGGMKQRVALARVLVLRPPMLLMDEPFAALDARLREKMQDLLLTVWEKLQLTVLFVTHDVEEALRISEQVVVFTERPGRIRASIEVKKDKLSECRSAIYKALL